VLLGQLAAQGERVVERRCDLADLHRATTLVVCNAVHGPRGAVLMRVPARGEAVVAAVGPGVEVLRACWERALAT
jgi:branched-subunit amino acid aminotransferase/4-amino-4-deoxychorismate lyase